MTSIDEWMDDLGRRKRLPRRFIEERLGAGGNPFRVTIQAEEMTKEKSKWRPSRDVAETWCN